MDIAYKPSKWQSEFHALTTHEALGAGAAGPGKSICLLMEPIVTQLRLENARCNGDPATAGIPPNDPLWDVVLNNKLRWGQSTGWALHLRRTSKMLLPTLAVADRLFKELDPKVRYNGDSMMYTFSSGYRYQFGHCHKPDDWGGYLSAAFTFLCFDELVQFQEEQYEQIKTRLRAFDKVLRPFMKTRAMSNPVMKMTSGDTFSVNDPQWVRRYFVDPAPEGRVVHRRAATNSKGDTVERTRIYLPAKLRDNPDPEFVANYEAQLLHAPPHMRKALLEGDWYVTAGSYFGDLWNSNVHVIRKFAIPREWPKFRSMDWGYKSYGCIHWWALDEDDNLICTAEFSFRLMTATEVARKVREIEKDQKLWGYDGSLITGPADNQLWEKRGDSGASKAEEMAAVGVHWVKADKASRRRNAERMLDRLGAHLHAAVRPGIAFFNTCIMAIRTIPSVQRDHNNIEEPAEGGDDHWVDSAWYACAYASRGRKGVAMLREHEDEDRDLPVARGQYGYGGF
jgi:hypothetical protein